jgi:1,4-dihydroxy-6-naphthoate synthase
MERNISLGFSPCPNDTFIFDAWVNQRLNTGNLISKLVIADVEELNRLSLTATLDVTKLSLSAFALVADHYELLTAGSALGINCGPLLISKNEIAFHDLSTKKIAIPGFLTTANLLLSLFAPEATNKHEVLFSEIEQRVLDDTYDAGLIIHESRFTYNERGLKKIADMGELWEATMHVPLPLGCIAIRKSLPTDLKILINQVMENSVSFAIEFPDASREFVKQHAQELSDEIIAKHIQLYVNSFTKQLGVQGKSAICTLLEAGAKNKLIPLCKIDFTDEHLTHSH